MKGLVITTENKMQVREFGEPAYETIGKAVGGWIEVVHPKGLPDPFCMVVNEEGLLHGLPLNLFGCILYDTVRHGNPIVGNIVILKEGFTTPGERDFIGLDEDDVKFLGAMAVSLSGGGIKWESEARYWQSSILPTARTVSRFSAAGLRSKPRTLTRPVPRSAPITPIRPRA